MQAIAAAETVVHTKSSVISEIKGTVGEGDRLVLDLVQDASNPQWIRVMLPDRTWGWVYGRSEGKNADTRFTPEPAHYLNKHIRIGIIHQNTYDKKEYHSLVRDVTTWRLFCSPPFVIQIERPQIGVAEVNMICPHCKARIDAVFPGTETFTKKKEPADRKTRQKKAVMIVLGLLPLLLSTITSILLFQYGRFLVGYLVLLGVPSIWVLLIARKAESAMPRMGGRIYADGKELKEEPLPKGRDGHYIAWVVSK